MLPSSASKTKPKPPRQSFQFEAIGTQWQIDMVVAVNVLDDIKARIQMRIEQFDADYSRFRSDSWLSKLSRAAGTYAAPTDARPLFGLYRHMYDVTHGAVTPLIGQLLSAAGYDATYSLRPKQLHKPPAWNDVLRYESDTNQLTVIQPVMLDVGAAGKGYLIDIVSELLESEGITDYCVDAGGDMRVRSDDNEALRVGMEHPDNLGQVIGVVDFENQSLCGSAGNRRMWAGLHHIFDPHTLQPVRHVKAVWAVADTTLLADGMTTCLFFIDPIELAKHFSFECVVLRSDQTWYQSPGFPGELFTAS